MKTILPANKESFKKTPEIIAQELFFDKTGICSEDATYWVKKALKNSDDGELYGEYTINENLYLVNGIIRNSTFNSLQGFGLRSINGEQVNYAHTNNLSPKVLKILTETISSANKGSKQKLEQHYSPSKTLYTSHNILEEITFNKKVELLKTIDSYTRKLNPYISQVIANLSISWSVIMIIKPTGNIIADIRPMSKLTVSVIANNNDRKEKGFYGGGGRKSLSFIFNASYWKKICNEAVRQAIINLSSVSAPAGAMPVIIGNGWGGVLLHEAIGHGLEGDAIRKKSSIYYDKLEQKISIPEVTIIDDGRIPGSRGSLNVDDEGTNTQKNILIENGYLKKFLQDRLNGRLSGSNSSGNGRRENYTHIPIPRMMNTMMMNGKNTKDEIFSSVSNGFYAASLSGGQVDTSSGKFVFEVSEGYIIKKGKIQTPVKGATLIGDGLEVLKNLSMVGNDSKLDPGIGVCGKEGQMIPVSVGQPTILVSSIIVGGTKNA